jgi:hypothetical protein
VAAFVIAAAAIDDAIDARRQRRVARRLDHLRGDDHRPAVAAAGADHALLDCRHALGRQFGAEVAARHRHRVGRQRCYLQRLDRRRLRKLA